MNRNHVDTQAMERTIQAARSLYPDDERLVEASDSQDEREASYQLALTLLANTH